MSIYIYIVNQMEYNMNQPILKRPGAAHGDGPRTPKSWRPGTSPSCGPWPSAPNSGLALRSMAGPWPDHGPETWDDPSKTRHQLMLEMIHFRMELEK